MHDPVAWIALAVSVVSVSFTGAGWWTSREKLRLDLYNRRFDIYSRTLDFYHALLDWDIARINNTRGAFIKASREAQFLFDDDSGIFRQLQQMHEDSSGMIAFKLTLAPTLGEADPDSLLEENMKNQERLERVRRAPELLEGPLSGYLDFHKLSA